MANSSSIVYVDGGKNNSHEASNKRTSFVLTGQNYLPWSQAVTIALRGCSKLGYVNGNIPTPVVDDSQYVDWEANDNLVMTWLFNSMDPAIYEIFAYSETSTELWNSLKNMYGHDDNSSLIFEIQQKISNMTQTPDQSFTEHFGNLKKKGMSLTSIILLLLLWKNILNVKSKTKFFNYLLASNLNMRM
ncbi:UBN2_3 domain-containing protein [Cephalotus follicularis]|uniref:UBN2_3 domain-containing protein n=1 Tax=Cephalotus follicularis TaxID=3775 RepID=A0A1Q3CSX2_CEPFO|nr:UBN2_3 domain-containing protein [Cephalotus follicularis]